MIDPANDNLSVTAQCRLLSLSRSSVYYRPKVENALNLTLMRLIDVQFLTTPFYGSRQMARHLRREGYLSRPSPGAAVDAEHGHHSRV